MPRITVTVPTSVKQALTEMAFQNRRSATIFTGALLEVVVGNGIAAQLFPPVKSLIGAPIPMAAPAPAPQVVSVPVPPMVTSAPDMVAPAPVAAPPGPPLSPMAIFAAGGSGVNDMMIPVNPVR